MATLTIADLDNGKRDLQTVEEVANSRAATATTRFGQQTTTLYEAIRRIITEGDAQLAEQKESAETVIRNLGFMVPVPYAPGIEVTESNFTVIGPDGNIYAAQAGQIPFTTGAWDAAQWYPIQNDLNDHKLLVFNTVVEAESAAATLPDGQLVSADGYSYEVVSGALLPVRPSASVAEVGTIAELRDLPPPKKKCTIYVRGYWYENDGGGGHFLWVPASNKVDNGGNVIKPTSASTGRWEWGGELNILRFGAVADDVTDSWDAIQRAVNAGKEGDVVKVPSGFFRVTKPISIKKGIVFSGEWAGWWPARLDPMETAIKPKWGEFVGDAIISIEKVDDGTGVYTGSDRNGGPRVRGINLLGVRAYNASSGAIHGIKVAKDVHDIRVTDVSISNFSGHGYLSSGAAGQQLYKVSVHNTLLAAYNWRPDPSGPSGDGAIDLIVDTCYAQASGAEGFRIENPNAATFIACRSEWNAGAGFVLRGKNYACMLIGCNTDYNKLDGFDQRVTGERPVIYNACLAKRDGSAGTYSGFTIWALAGEESPGAILSACGTQVGVADDGSGSFAPAYGVTTTRSGAVGIDGGYFFATSQPLRDNSNTISISGSVRTFVKPSATSITETTAAGERIVGNAQTRRGVDVRTIGGGRRWFFGANEAAESGANAGSDFLVTRFDDAGAGLGASLTISRDNGDWTLHDYKKTRNDAASYGPENFLYTDSAGILRSAPLFVPPPSSATSIGVRGQQAFDANHHYVCYATNSWMRIAKSAW